MGDFCIWQGKVALISAYGIHQLHIFIFVLAVFHILQCIITLALGRTKVQTPPPFLLIFMLQSLLRCVWESVLEGLYQYFNFINKCKRLKNILKPPLNTFFELF